MDFFQRGLTPSPQKMPPKKKDSHPFKLTPIPYKPPFKPDLKSQKTSLTKDSIKVHEIKSKRELLPKKGYHKNLSVFLNYRDLKLLTKNSTSLCIGFFTDQRDRTFDNLTIVQKVSIEVNNFLINIPNIRYDIDSDKVYGSVEYIDIGYVLNLSKKVSDRSCYKFPLKIKNNSRQKGTDIWFQVVLVGKIGVVDEEAEDEKDKNEDTRSVSSANTNPSERPLSPSQPILNQQNEKDQEENMQEENMQDEEPEYQDPVTDPYPEPPLPSNITSPNLGPPTNLHSTLIEAQTVNSNNMDFTFDLNQYSVKSGGGQNFGDFSAIGVGESDKENMGDGTGIGWGIIFFF